MQMSYREQFHDERPYWKVAASLAMSLIATVLFVYVGFRLMVFFMPFVIGWFIAYVSSPVVNWLERRVNIMKKLGSAIIIIGVLAAVVLLIYFVVSQISKEVAELIRNMPSMYRDLERGMAQIGGSLQGIFEMLPEGIRSGWQDFASNMDRAAGDIIGRISQPAATAAGKVARRVPSLFIATIVTFISAYFFIAEREEVIAWAKRVSPEPVVRRMTMVMDNLKYAVGGYFKAQFKIMGVVFLLLLVGFIILGISFNFLLALLVAFLDFLPFFGTGTALLPWAVYKFLVGDYKMMIGLLILYGITQLVRQLIQPKLVGDSMGLRPLLTLVLLYIGYRIGGVFGMIFAVPVGLILINLCRAGAFDYILDDVKLLAEGALSLRNPHRYDEE